MIKKLQFSLILVLVLLSACNNRDQDNQSNAKPDNSRNSVGEHTATP
jgi:hypothetical protein